MIVIIGHAVITRRLGTKRVANENVDDVIAAEASVEKLTREKRLLTVKILTKLTSTPNPEDFSSD